MFRWWGWTRPPQPFIPGQGVYQMPVPAPDRSPRPAKPQQRRSPGHPGCPDCRAARGGTYVAVSAEGGKTFAVSGIRPAGCCDRHMTVHYSVDPRRTVG